MRVAHFSLLILTLAGAAEASEGRFARRWMHVSETSAVIYWQLPEIESAGTSRLEYGTDARCEMRTEESGEPRLAHLHRLTDLEPATTYHYRMLIVVGGRTHRSELLSFTTRRIAGALRLPGTLGDPPFMLDQPDATYILTEDIVAAGTAIVIAGTGITLDLDGHTVVFGDDTQDQVFGVHVKSEGPAVVCNGRIVQGRRSGDYSSCVESRYREHGAEVFGVSTDVHLPNTYPLRFFGRTVGARVHHNHLSSRVTEIESRHYPGNDLLRLDACGGGVEVFDNLLTDGCHVGIRLGGGEDSGAGPPPELHHNDIRHHARYVNGYALALSCRGADVHHNRVTSTGRGVHLTAEGIELHNNHLDLRGHMTLDDMPQGSRPFRERRVELHGIKLEGEGVRNCRIHDNFVRIVQRLPDDEWDYVPATPLNIACYHPEAMNEVHANEFIALTEHRETRHGPYGDAGQWAAAVFLVGMNRGPAPEGRYSILVRNNRFFSNHLFVAAARPVDMTVRIEQNRFHLVKDPRPAQGRRAFRGIGAALEEAIAKGGNRFVGMRP